MYFNSYFNISIFYNNLSDFDDILVSSTKKCGGPSKAAVLLFWFVSSVQSKAGMSSTFYYSATVFNQCL